MHGSSQDALAAALGTEDGQVREMDRFVRLVESTDFHPTQDELAAFTDARAGGLTHRLADAARYVQRVRGLHPTLTAVHARLACADAAAWVECVHPPAPLAAWETYDSASAWKAAGGPWLYSCRHAQPGAGRIWAGTAASSKGRRVSSG